MIHLGSLLDYKENDIIAIDKLMSISAFCTIWFWLILSNIIVILNEFDFISVSLITPLKDLFLIDLYDDQDLLLFKKTYLKDSYFWMIWIKKNSILFIKYENFFLKNY
jgi:hypothetical protein